MGGHWGFCCAAACRSILSGRRAVMERKIISKTNDTSKLASRDRELQDSELASVSGGLVVNPIIAVLIDPLPPYNPVAPAKHWFNGG